MPQVPALSHCNSKAVGLVGTPAGDPIVAHHETMTTHVKIEFGRNRSGVIADQQQQTLEDTAAAATADAAAVVAAATSHASGGNAVAVLPAGGTRANSCAVDDYFKVSAGARADNIPLCRRSYGSYTLRWVPYIWQRTWCSSS